MTCTSHISHTLISKLQAFQRAMGLSSSSCCHDDACVDPAVARSEILGKALSLISRVRRLSLFWWVIRSRIPPHRPINL